MLAVLALLMVLRVLTMLMLLEMLTQLDGFGCADIQSCDLTNPEMWKYLEKLKRCTYQYHNFICSANQYAKIYKKDQEVVVSLLMWVWNPRILAEGEPRVELEVDLSLTCTLYVVSLSH